MLDDNTWVTNNLDDAWLDFPPGRIWGLAVGKWVGDGREPIEMHAWVSAAQYANDGGDNWSEASGNLAEFWAADKGVINVSNVTCTHWYLRVLLRAAPLPPPPPTDASSDAPGQTAEGGVDGAADAGADTLSTDAPSTG
jgi:hypothetical protein